MTVFDLLKGKKINVMSDMGVELTMEISSVKEVPHSRQITPDTRENDWWGETVEWITYEVTFTTGKTKDFKKITDINLI